MKINRISANVMNVLEATYSILSGKKGVKIDVYYRANDTVVSLTILEAVLYIVANIPLISNNFNSRSTTFHTQLHLIF